MCVINSWFCLWFVDRAEPSSDQAELGGAEGGCVDYPCWNLIFHIDL